MAIRPLVVDINHADGSREENGKHVDLIDFAKVRAAGFLGVIHKASEGEHFVDPLYAERKPKAISAGLHWGAYHLMRPGDVGNQVSSFLGVVRDPRSSVEFTRYALDYEDERLGLWQAQNWMDLVYSVTGQTPWLYGGGVLKDQLKIGAIPALTRYPLWLAEYGPVAKLPHGWDNYVLWQRSGDGVGPGIHDIPGIGRKQDINYFAGSDDDLRKVWTA